MAVLICTIVSTQHVSITYAFSKHNKWVILQLYGSPTAKYNESTHRQEWSWVSALHCAVWIFVLRVFHEMVWAMCAHKTPNPPTANVGVISRCLLVSTNINYAFVCACWWFKLLTYNLVKYCLCVGVRQKTVVFVNICNLEFPLSGVSV